MVVFKVGPFLHSRVMTRLFWGSRRVKFFVSSVVGGAWRQGKERREELEEERVGGEVCAWSRRRWCQILCRLPACHASACAEERTLQKVLTSFFGKTKKEAPERLLVRRVRVGLTSFVSEASA